MVTVTMISACVTTRVRNTWAEMAMPLMMRRPSLRAGSSAARESSSRTMSATSRATALPLRMATLTSAAFIALTSLTPSPTTATL
jgi:hypothetical protein